MSPLVSMHKLAQGRPSNKHVKRNERKAERGVCRIRKCCFGGQGYQTVGCGILIKYQIPQWRSKYLIATVNSVFQDGFDAKYRVDFVRSRSRLKTFELDRNWITQDAASGMIVIALDSHSPVFRRRLNTSSVMTHRPFEVELFDKENSAFSDGLCVHVVADGLSSDLFSVKPHNLIQDTTTGQRSYTLENFNPATEIAFGGAILRKVGKKWTAVGVINSSTIDSFSTWPIWLSEAVFANLKSVSITAATHEDQNSTSGNENSLLPATPSATPPREEHDDSSGNATKLLPSTPSTTPPPHEEQDDSSGNATNLLPLTLSTTPPHEEKDSSLGNATNVPPSTPSTTSPHEEQNGSSGNATNLCDDRNIKKKPALQVVRLPRDIPKKRPTPPKPNTKELPMCWDQQVVVMSTELSSRQHRPGLPIVTGFTPFKSAGSQDTGITGFPTEQDEDIHDTIEMMNLKLKSYELKLQAKSLSCDQLQNRVTQLEGYYEECKVQHADLLEQNKQLRGRNIELLALEAESQDLIGKLQEMLHWKHEDCHKLQEDCHKLQEDCQKWQEKCHQLKEQLAKQKREVEECREKVGLQEPEQAGIGDATAHDGARSDCSSVFSGGMKNSQDSLDLED